MRHPSPKLTKVFPVIDNVSDSDNLFATCTKGQFQTMSEPDSPKIVNSLYVLLNYKKGQFL